MSAATAASAPELAKDHVRIIYVAQFPHCPPPDMYEIQGNRGVVTKDFPYVTPIGVAYEAIRNRQARIDPRDAKTMEAFQKIKMAREAQATKEYEARTAAREKAMRGAPSQYPDQSQAAYEKGDGAFTK